MNGNVDVMTRGQRDGMTTQRNKRAIPFAIQVKESDWIRWDPTSRQNPIGFRVVDRHSDP
jgi:hypothetical protein